MPVEKQGFNIPFGQGIDQKTDPNQVSAGKFLVLENAQFNKGGLLEKRNGFGALTTLPEDSDATTLTTLNDGLIATGSSLQAYSPETNQWLNRGLVQPVKLDVVSLNKNSGSQLAPDAVIASNGLVCSVFTESGTAYYQVSEYSTGQTIVSQTALPATAACPRVFLLGRNFVVTYLATIAGTPHLQYIAVPISKPTAPSAAVDISTQVSSISAAYDAVVANDTLFMAWDGSDLGGAIRTTFFTSTLAQGNTNVTATYFANRLSVTADTSASTPVVWISWWETTNNDGYVMAKSQILGTVLAPTKIINNVDVENLTTSATDGMLHVYYEVVNVYSYVSVRTDYISQLSVTQSGTISATTVLLRSVGLASKSFYYNGTRYLLVEYGEAFQPTYFLIDEDANIILKLAYSNGGALPATQVLPQVTLINSTLCVPYTFKDILVSVNKEVDAPSVGGIYSQTGINLAKIQINVTGQLSADIASNLHLTGGILWQYDAVKPVEHGFHLWPEEVFASTSGAGGLITAQEYFYAFTYEWTDAQGNLHRSAPSIPLNITTTGATSTNTLKVPTLRLTYKTGANKVRIVGYRWSTAQPVFYQFTSISSPTLNNTTADSVTITDALADSSILGNTILYTTGGVLENIGAPANTGSALYRNRLMLIDAEDQNLLWYSKQVLSGTPVEFTDLQTIYVAPTASTQAPTGPIKVITAMDDKLIVFKKNAIYYITGNGPDATGAQNDFSEPVFITSVVGCENPNSVAFIPQGIMFESAKGIWLLGRDLSTTYIGDAVDDYMDVHVKAALTIPGTNEVRFTMEDGVTLAYDYFYQQWCSYTGISGISATIFQGLHTYLNQYGQVRQETPGLFLDGSNPVLMRFKTAWLKLTNLQGFQRAYFFYFLGKFLSPHKLDIKLSYDYDSAYAQATLITPNNTISEYGDDVYYGSGSPYGGTASLEQWRIFFDRQKCQAIQITVDELYDPSQGIAAGAGFTMSGINMVLGGKLTFPKLPAKQAAG